MEAAYLEQLEKLAELKDKGVLSESEFHLKKSELLARGTLQAKPASPATTPGEGSYWLPIPSLVLGILCMLALFDESGWDQDTVAGLVLFAMTGLVLGVISVCRQTLGRGMAIAGIVMASIGLLAALGM